MQVDNFTGSYPAMETLMKGFSDGAPSFIDKAGSYIKENVKPKLEFKEKPSFASGFAAPLAVAGVQAAKNLAAKKGVLPLLTTAKAYNMSAASVPTEAVALKGTLRAPGEAPTIVPLDSPKGISWDNIASAGAGALGLVGAVALTKLAKAGVKKAKRVHALMKMDAQAERERNSARLRVLEDSGLADHSDRKRALALPVETGEFSVLDSVIKAGKAAAKGVSNLAKGNSASIKGLESLAKSAGEARSSLFSGKSQTYGLKDKVLSKIHIGDIGSDSRSKIVTSQAQNLEKGGGSVADFFDKRAQRGMNKVNSLTEQLNKATSDDEKTKLNDMISRETSKVQKNLGRKEIISDSTKALSDLAKENPKIVRGAESAIKSAAKTSQMNARARASEAEAQRLNAQSQVR